MSGDIHIRKEGRAGRITLTRPRALNAVSHEMCRAIEDALDVWRDDDAVALVVIDAEGDKAFCAGGDLQHIYETGRAGDYGPARRFWADEYRLNAKIAAYPKPYVALMQGFVMGGGVGIACHGSHRVVCESTQIAMPECGIGLVPDVGGTYLLSRAPGRAGAYLGTTGARMGPEDAIFAGFADVNVPQGMWPELTRALEETGDPGAIAEQSETAPEGRLRARQGEIDAAFAGDTLGAILATLRGDEGGFARDALAAMTRNSPLSMACTLEILRRLRDGTPDIRQALHLESRVTYRAIESGDFLEGIRAAIIDRDKTPRWQHGLDDVPPEAVAQMLAPLDGDALRLEEERAQ